MSRFITALIYCLVFATQVQATSTSKDLQEVDLVKVNKSDRIMQLVSNNQIIREYSISLGGQPKGHKQKEGDQRTPEGSYILDYKKEDSAFYRSMHVSYPNASDKAHAKALGVSPGGFIMVHGQRNYLGWLAPIMQQFDWTDGCIALTNAEMDEFMALVSVGTEVQIQW
ncbi:L,D-transpeptidase family protein [Shewanella sp. WXL01]|uniref:L,D-transpeptidase family protein n=1 Tax=Shewanella sp. WXL01 TaxID=2709721 RepID=UPI001438553D|nr:L,D-transpeptidase family protein [Shewanella sp. WXL01]NKF52276.1 L,D-transpeptidase family protein [Shewanella sp. WXL01]